MPHSNDADLFKNAHALREPLAARMRPRTLDEYIGQDHIVGKGRLLRRAIAADQLSSVIFYGPPGSGKTTLARVIANHTKSNFITLNAVLTGVADIRTAIKQAEDFYSLYSRRTILFVDEVHRWNKAQQDALLPWVENGTIILIGATTENPFFEVNKALVSRSRVFQLKPLTNGDLRKAAEQALGDKERGYGHWKVEFEKGALEHLIETANGDARSLLNALELAVETTPEKWDAAASPPVPAWGSTIYISREAAEESIQKKVVLYDRDGDYHYDIISAFIKSLRGRDPDAAMYWLARMVAAGEDASFIFRRMLISACEDTGLADPNAVSIVASCADAFDRVGMPEGRYFLAHAALYLSTAPKSNSSMAFFDALASVEKEDAEVPNHLRDGNRDAEGFGHGEGYLYPHAYRDHWVAQQYLPDALVGRVFYTPGTQGYEKTIRGDVLSRREIQIASLLEREAPSAGGGESTQYKTAAGTKLDSVHFINNKKGEHLTFSPADAAKETALDRADKSWRARLDSNRAEVLLAVRDTMTELAGLLRHHRSLVWNADDGLLLWDVARKTPEGMTCGLCRTEKGKEILEQYGRTLGDLDKPVLQVLPEGAGGEGITSEIFSDIVLQFAYRGAEFDRLFFRNPFTSPASIESLAASLSHTGLKKEAPSPTSESEQSGDVVFAEGWLAVIAQRIPKSAQYLSRIVETQILTPATLGAYEDTLAKMKAAEDEFFGDTENPLFNWDASSVVRTFENEGFTVRSLSRRFVEKRRITEAELAKWFDAKSSAYGARIADALSSKELEKIVRLLESARENTVFDWESETTFFTIEENKERKIQE
ncbi:AAA family ATPase [Treponema sp. Marseille-Q4130]|uniref:AAA family ATPase n=1 Tax=Treponema sp. Marseille-Q4130 TaxID=2766702 RepID=UPI001652462B|nr:AAA family ATPase [Treponema sp. Marseille-Q4130]MBC6719100.1 AAA family ATPase [Treponema sp. Marseille-Q4130]